MEESLIEDKRTSAESLAINLGAAQTIAGFAFQSNLIKEVGETRDTVYVRFVKPTGEIYMSTILGETGEIIVHPSIHTDATIIVDDVYDGKEIKTVISPVSGAYTVWLGFSLGRINMVINERIKEIVITSLIILIIADFSVFLIVKKMTFSLKEVMKGVDIIGKGNLDYRINVKTKDEIDALASAINKSTAELKKSRVKLERYSTDLEKQVYDRTKDLEKTLDQLKDSQGKIKQQNIRLKKLDHIKSEFLNVTSHELRTPLTSIKGYIQMMLNQSFGEISEDQKKALEVVIRNSNRLDHLVQDILDISQLQSGTMKFIPKLTNIGKLVDETFESMQPSADLKQIKIRLDVEDNLPELIIDDGRIKQVMMNLVDNAIKFSPNGSVINVRVENEENHVLFEVEDFGRGVPKKQEKKVFEAFYQVDSGMDRKFGGVGLGLAISQSIAVAHGGKIWVESKEGKGSTFRFVLPVKPVQDVEGVFEKIDMFSLGKK